ncbi:transcription initiation factor TFIID subunit 4 isoform X2 [Leptopilina boulardi]|uniref:transcription initiation factor TFIID subunit 4 isoform X2 n=1 Tax=Leptopilina boulardi TaxID=63433 RepID=UPI0021F53252|nr:transcription initiation factor TFIID subunit 4 isoform X2 [Leptopilina boulardi]
MASAKFLEEALSTDVDESAVNAIVGSLETQLVTSTPTIAVHQPTSVAISQQNHQVNSTISNGGTISAVLQTQKHGVANGGSQTSVNSLMTQEVPKSITTSTLLPVNVVTTNAVAPQVTAQQQQQQQQQQQHLQQQNQSTVAATYINQVTSNQTVPALTKTHEQVKIIYSGAGQVIATTGVVNANNKITFPAQNVGQLANGTLGVTTQTVLQTANVVTNTGTVVQQNNQGVNVNKPTGTALVIKSSGTPGGMVSVPLSVPVSVGGNAVNTTLQSKAGVTSTIVPSNMQILNMNTIRQGTPVAGQQGGKQVAPRLVIGQPMVGARPGAPITLQAFHGLQIQGNLIVKTENGQYQCIRVAAPASAAPGGTAVTPNSIGANTMVATPTGGTTYRLASVPVTAQASVTSVTPNATVTQSAPTTVPVTTQNANVTTGQTGQAPVQRQTTDNTKEKCRKFLANLLELSSREPKHVEIKVRTLIQELIDTKVEPEQFCDRLEKLLNASPQPCLIGFLKKSLPLLRQSLVTKELVIEGIRPPPANVVFCIASATPATVQPQLRNTVAVFPVSVAAVATAGTPIPSATATATTQVRLMTPQNTVATAAPRGVQQVQQRLIRPITTVARTQATAIRSAMAVSTIRPSATVVQKTATTTVLKTIAAAAQGKAVNATTTLNKQVVVPSVQSKPTIKEKEKKTFSSAGYTGDDDINDVAAMGGVNLAEESQRILGSTEFVGTQIRSCKDEAFLHLSPLQQRIKQIVLKYGLEEPNQEVSTLISHAVQERLKNLVEKLAIIGEHRVDLNKMDPRYEISQDVRGQLKFLEDLDRVERKRHEEHEREMLLRAAKSRAKTEDPEQAKLKAKAKEMQRAEMEELRQREANLTALQAIGPRKKPKLDTGGATASPASSGLNATSSGMNRQMSMRPRVKRVNIRDMLFLLEQEKDTCRSTTLYKSYLK